MGNKEVKKEKIKKDEKGGLLKLVQFFEFVFVLLILYLIAISELVIMNIHVFYSNIGVSIL